MDIAQYIFLQKEFKVLHIQYIDNFMDQNNSYKKNDTINTLLFHFFIFILNNLYNLYYF